MKGKMILSLAVAAIGVVMMSHPAQADTYTVDSLLGGGAQTLANASTNAEEGKLEELCNCGNLTLLGNFSGTVLADDAGNSYINEPAEPGYFVLKFGEGLTQFYFFQNIGELDKLVWNGTQVTTTTGLSHYAYAGGTSSVPEPSSLLLLGAGLAGLGIWRRKKA